MTPDGRNLRRNSHHITPTREPEPEQQYPDESENMPETKNPEIEQLCDDNSKTSVETDSSNIPVPPPRRSTRIRKKPDRLTY